MREMKRALCLILTFLILTSNVLPASLLSTSRAEAIKNEQDKQVPSADSEDAPEDEEEVQNPSDESEDKKSEEEKSASEASKDKQEEKSAPEVSKDKQEEKSAPEVSKDKQEKKSGSDESEDESTFAKRKDKKATSKNKSDKEEEAENKEEETEEEEEQAEDKKDKKEADEQDEQVTSFRLIYFQPNKEWAEGNSRYAVVITTTEGENWIEGIDLDKDGRVEFVIPDEENVFRFVRLDADQMLNKWKYVLNQTEELTLPKDETLDLFLLDEKDKEKEKETGEWVEADETPLPDEEEDKTALKKGVKADESPSKDEDANEAEKTDKDEKTSEDNGNASRGAKSQTPLRDVTPGWASIYGYVVFNDHEFEDLVRPQTFNQTMYVVPYYQEGEEEIEADPWVTQSLSPSDPCYIWNFRDQDGKDCFEIEKVPRTVTINGESREVVKYSVTIPNPQPSYYHFYDADRDYLKPLDMDVPVPLGNNVTMVGMEVNLYLKYNLITFEADVVPDDHMEPIFNWDITFTRPEGVDVDAKKDAITIHVTSNNLTGNATHDGIVGFPYKAEQIENVDYRLGDGDTRVNWSEDGTETVPEEYGYTIRSVNYPKNMRLPFSVKWIDNNNPDRPDNSDIFTLQVKKTREGEDTWADFPMDMTADELYEAYGINKAPELVVQGNYYYFTGLPGVDFDTNPLDYRVVCTAPNNYTTNREIILADDTVTLCHSHSFTASIEWKDDTDADHFRPDDLTELRLYSRTSNGTLTEITGDRSTWQWDRSDTNNTWSLTVPGLPTYTDGDQENEEIEYFLVHGTDDKTELVETVTPAQIELEGGMVYTPYYHNGTGSHANDEQRCYDGGTITMLLSSNTTFSANLQWKDDNRQETINARPAVTLTLWRYANNGQTLDEAFKSEQASMVVYLDAQRKEQPLSFDMPAGSQNATMTTGENCITFTYKDSNGVEHSKTIDGITLPGHDGAGQKYTYFVRETLTGSNRNNYSTTYTHTHDTVTDTYLEGAPNGGTVTNTRREKAMVTMDKTWRNPDGLEQIAGASVQLKLFAKRQGDTNAQAEELQVFNADEGSYEVLTGNTLIAAQTAKGFTATIPTAQKSYYVNIYDDEGYPYDMQCHFAFLAK